MMFNHIGIIGLGLIGGSLARDIKTLKLAKHITGIDTNPLQGEFLKNNGIIDQFEASSEHVDSSCDLIILASPPHTLGAVAATLSPLTHEGSLVIDTASVKEQIIAEITAALPSHVLYVPCHPISGSEKSGANHSKESLFKDRRVVITPLDHTPELATDLIVDFWDQLGAHSLTMTPQMHDLIYAYMSHLPHILAYVMAESLAHHQVTPDARLQQNMRIADSSPALWASILSYNSHNIMKGLEGFLHVLSQIIAELRSEDAEEDAPTTSEQQEHIAHQLFPRIIASALISAVTLCEKREQMSLATFAGAGFMDLASPVQHPPEEDMEQISDLYKPVSELLMIFDSHLRRYYGLMHEKDWNGLEATLTTAQQHWRQMCRPATLN